MRGYWPSAALLAREGSVPGTQGQASALAAARGGFGAWGEGRLAAVQMLGRLEPSGAVGSPAGGHTLRPKAGTAVRKRAVRKRAVRARRGLGVSPWCRTTSRGCGPRRACWRRDSVGKQRADNMGALVRVAGRPVRSTARGRGSPEQGTWPPRPCASNLRHESGILRRRVPLGGCCPPGAARCQDSHVPSPPARAPEGAAAGGPCPGHPPDGVARGVQDRKPG